MKQNLGGNTRVLTAMLIVAGFGLMAACVKLPRHSPASNQQATRSPAIPTTLATRQINLNTVPAAELEKLPGVGKAMAARIVEHRTTFGPFRRLEHLIAVRGISDKKFRAIQPFVTIEQ